MPSGDKLLPNEFSLLSFEMQTDHDFDRQLAKYLYSKGLAVSQYRKLTADTYYTFSFIDDTPGQIEKCLQIYAIAEIADERDDLLYVGFEEFKEKLYRSSFVASEERAGLALLELQLGYKGAYRQ